MKIFFLLAFVAESVRFHENSVSRLYDLNTFYNYCFMRKYSNRPYFVHYHSGFGVNHSRDTIEMAEIEDLCGGLLADRIQHQSKRLIEVKKFIS